mmetsp:Transcript_72031/g.222499  ORF Transcript_72031/g.222499 Transcript_72031/m.222499 type:complete len:159 (+) Transcript_72031:47-523(+)
MKFPWSCQCFQPLQCYEDCRCGVKDDAADEGKETKVEVKGSGSHSSLQAVGRSWNADHEEEGTHDSKDGSQFSELDEAIVAGLVQMLGTPRDQATVIQREGALVLRLTPESGNKGVDQKGDENAPTSDGASQVDRFLGFQEVGAIPSECDSMESGFRI